MKYILSIVLILFIGCADKNLPSKYYKNGDYEKSYNAYLIFADKGFPKDSFKIAYMIYQNKINKPPYIERKYALQAYKHGYPKASLFIADSFFREKNFKESIKWYKKTDLQYFASSDFDHYIFAISQLENYQQQNRLLQQLSKQNNPYLLTLLGKFYLNSNYFYNPKYAIELFKKAYNMNYPLAGVELGVYYIKHNNKEGYYLLKKLIYKDAKSGYYLGNYLYDKMIEEEQKLNTNCNASRFTQPKQFFIKKLTIYKYNDLFTRKNIIKAYKISNQLGNKKALYKLFKLDIEDNTFELAKTTYSGFDLNKTISYLQKQNDLESKLILGSIYEKYLFLHKNPKKIYISIENIDKVKSYWHLYLYEKQFEDTINYKYLDYLVKQKFPLAIIEKAYQDIMKNINIQQNIKILQYYAHQNNISAINYLGSLYSHQILLPKDKSFDFYIKACSLRKKPFYIPNEDFKIVNYENNLTKILTVDYYYAQMKNHQAQFNLAKFYKNNGEYQKMKYWYYVLNKEADNKAGKLYYEAILRGYIDGDFNKALAYLKTQNDAASYEVLGDLYANGYGVEFSPKKAEEYYNKALKTDKSAILKIINLYKKINVNHKYDSKIISLYKKAINMNIKDAKLLLAQFYYNIGEYKKAKKIILSLNHYNSQIRYLAHLLNINLPSSGTYSNNGSLLLLKAKKLINYNPKEALLYTFRAILCNEPNAPMLGVKLMKKINNVNVIKQIYKQAKTYPKCVVYK